MLYITKDELRLILSDLPGHHVVGRSWKQATELTNARVSYAHVDLDYLRDNIRTEDLDKINQTYKHMPDLHYQDEVGAVITPKRFDGLDVNNVQPFSKSQHANLWGLYSDRVSF